MTAVIKIQLNVAHARIVNKQISKRQNKNNKATTKGLKILFIKYTECHIQQTEHNDLIMCLFIVFCLELILFDWMTRNENTNKKNPMHMLIQFIQNRSCVKGLHAVQTLNVFEKSNRTKKKTTINNV